MGPQYLLTEIVPYREHAALHLLRRILGETRFRFYADRVGVTESGSAGYGNPGGMLCSEAHLFAVEMDDPPLIGTARVFENGIATVCDSNRSTLLSTWAERSGLLVR